MRAHSRLYDRGNIILTDHNFIILQLLRQRADDATDVRFAVHERYPIESARTIPPATEEDITAALAAAKPEQQLRKVLNGLLPCGPSVLQHALLQQGFPQGAVMGTDFAPDDDIPRVLAAIAATREVDATLSSGTTKGYIFLKAAPAPKPKPQKKAKAKKKRGAVADPEPADPPSAAATAAEQPPLPAGAAAEVAPTGEAAAAQAQELFYDEFHPFLLEQHSGLPVKEFDSFDRAADTFFSEIEAQKQELRLRERERAALQKLTNVEQDHAHRISSLLDAQRKNELRATMIEYNVELVDRALLIINSAVAAGSDWKKIGEMVAEAKEQGDAVATRIKSLHLDRNAMVMELICPSFDSDESDGSDAEESAGGGRKQPKREQRVTVELDLSLGAYANARSHYDKKRQQAAKQEKTVAAGEHALRQAQKKTASALKETEKTKRMIKARKTYWFEKYLWFISSDNLLVVGGHDRQQNETLVRRYLDKGDIYVHADFHGAASCVIKNQTGHPVPPRTLDEAGAMAVAHSSAWNAKIVTGAYWVHHDQVSKTAPSGEYLTTGAFMIRGKKNFLTAGQQVYGLGILFKLNEASVAKHLGDRSPKDRAAAEPGDPGASIVRATAKVETTQMVINYSPTNALYGPSVIRDLKTLTKTLPAAGEGVPPADPVTPPSTVAQGGADGESMSKHVTDAADSAPESGAEKEASDDDEAFPETKVDVRFVSGATTALESESSVGGDSAARAIGGAAAETTATRRLTAKEKRDRRKQRAGAGQPVGVDGLPDGGETPVAIVPQATETQPAKPKAVAGGVANAPDKRGQKKKQQLRKKKYADQDEEDRRIAMELLASAGDAEKLSRKAKRKLRKEQGAVGSKKVTATGAQGLEMPAEAAALLSTESALPIPLVPREHWDDAQQQASMAAKDEQMRLIAEEEEEEIRRLLESEDAPTLTEEQRRGISFFDMFTGAPHPDDVLDFAIPMSAPLSALSTFKFRVKLIPGSQGKGKAMKSILEAFSRSKQCTAAEKELVRAIRDTDGVANVPGKVRVTGMKM